MDPNLIHQQILEMFFIEKHPEYKCLSPLLP